MSEFIQRLYTTLILIPMSLAFLYYAPHWAFTSVVFLVLFIILTTEWPRLISPKRAAFWVLTPIYPSAPFLALIAVDNSSRLLTFLLIGTVVAHDIGSYIAGKLWGKHTIIPSVSPGKTWQGFAGGYVAAFLITLLFFFTQTHVRNCFLLALLAAAISTTALLGDLFESYLKRRAGLKDSGSILPGHGGLLDRFDALMLVSVLFYFLRTYLLTLLKS